MVQHIDAHLHILNMQAETYPNMFNNIKWTCLGSLYSRNVKYAYTLFVRDRKMYADKGIAGAPIAWANLDVDMCKYVHGVNDNWLSKAWMYCDHIYGVENIGNAHWAAYAYDFQAKEVKVFDSMSNAYEEQRSEVFSMHAAIAPSLYNESLNGDKGKLDPNTPFAVKVVEVPQQPNGSDCGVYAIKFVQCLAMNADFQGLVESNFKDYRLKLALDLIHWSKDGGKWKFHEENIL